MIATLSRIGWRGLRHWSNLAEGADHVRRLTLAARLSGQGTVTLRFEDGLFVLEEEGARLYLARKARVATNLAGLRARQARLRRDYFLDQIDLSPGDVVIDCGANVGEVSLLCAAAGARVIAFEPDRREFAALCRNAEGRAITPLPLALWHEAGEMPFHDCNDSGDSSLIAAGGDGPRYLVRTGRLDEVAEVPDAPIRLIKLEAEGAEPEIVEGMARTLRRTEFVSADLGPERGQAQENTVVPVTNALFAQGFTMVRFSAARCTALFHRPA